MTTRLAVHAEAEAELLLQLARQLVEGDVWDLDERRDARILVTRLINHCRKVCIKKHVADLMATVKDQGSILGDKS